MLDVPSVQQEWVPASVHCKKLLPLRCCAYPLTPCSVKLDLSPFRAFFPEEKKLMTGVSVFVGEAGGEVRDVGKADKESLWATITYHGGKVASSLQEPGVTHLIVALPLGASYNQGLNMENLQVVGPDWVIETVRAGKRCEEALYHPRLLNIPENPAPSIPKPTRSGPGRAVTDQLKPKVTMPTTPASTAPGPRPVLAARGPNLPGQAPTPPPQQPIVSMPQQQQIQAAIPPRPNLQPTATTTGVQGVPSSTTSNTPSQLRPMAPGQMAPNQMRGTQPAAMQSQMQVRPSSVAQSLAGQVTQSQPGQGQMSQTQVQAPRRSTPGPMPQPGQMRMSGPNQIQQIHQGQPGQQQPQQNQPQQPATAEPALRNSIKKQHTIWLTASRPAAARATPP